MKKLKMFVFLFLSFFLSLSFVSGVNWVDNSNRLYQFGNEEIVTGYATDYNNKGSFTSVTKTTETGKSNYIEDMNKHRISSNTSLIGITQAFEYNKANKFFYCSETVKSIFYSGINNLDLQELNPSQTPNETDYSIKCFDDPNDSNSNPSFLIAIFLGSSLNLKYKIEEKRWYLLYNSKGLTLDFVKLPYTKSEGNTENYLFVVKGEGDTLKFTRVEFTLSSADANTVGFGDLPSDLVYYDKVQIGIDKAKTKFSSSYQDYVLLFTYKKGDTKFKYYYVYFEDQNDPVVIKYGDEITFPFFNGYIIEDIKFIKGSQTFFYHIKKDSVSYIGVGDLLYGIQIYNIPKDSVDIISIDNTNYLSTEQSLVYSVKNELYKVCPFVKSSDNNICNIPNKQGHFLIDSNGNTETSSCEANVIEKYCVKECPSRYMMSSGTCVECEGDTPYYDNVNKKCISECTSDLMEDSKTKICYSCQSVGKYKYGNQCIDDCAAVFAEPNKEGVCEVCKDKQLYFENGKCVNQCSTGKGAFEDGTCIYCKTKDLFLVDGKCKNSCLDFQLYDEDNICYYCYNTNNKYYEKGKCVEQCSRGAAIDSEKFVCTVCKDIKKKLYKNQCIDSCPEFFVSDDEDVCVTCESQGKYYEKGKCVKQCSEGYATDKTLYRCIFCKDIEKFYFDDKCVNDCPDYYLPNDENICYTCKSIDKFYEEGECVNQCNPASAKNETEKICTHCSVHGQYYEYNKCVEKCKDFEAIFDDNVCKYCHHYKEGYLYQNGSCVEHCSLGFENKEVGGLHVCESCGSFLYYHGKCLNGTKKEECPKNTVYNESFHGCYNCGDFGGNETFYENGKCVFSCSKGTEIDTKAKTCRICKNEGLYYEDEKCVGKCRDYSIIDPDTWSCSNCSAQNKYFLNNTTCVDKCPKGYETNDTINVCINCKEQGKVIYINKCYDSCPKNSYADQNFTCKSCFCNGENSKCIADEKSYHCNCEEGFQGDHCEIYHIQNKILNIYSVKSSVILSEENEFAFTYNKANSKVRQLFSNSTLGKNIDYYYHWSLTNEDQNGNVIDANKDYDEELFLNGFSEERFKIGKKALKEQKKNKISLTLIDVKENKTYTDKLYVNVLIAIDNLTLEVKYNEESDSYIPMSTTVSIYVIDKTTSREDELYYQFFYYDEKEELIPLTGKTKESNIETLLPEASSAVVYVSNDRGEFIELKAPLYYSIDTNNRTINEIMESENPPHIKAFYLNHYFCQQSNDFNTDHLKTVLDFTWTQLSNKLESENKKESNDEYDFVKPNLYISLLNKVANFINETEDLSKNISNILAVDEIVSKTANQINNYKTPSISHETLISLYRNLDVLVEINEKYINQQNDNINDDKLYKSAKESINKIKNVISRQMSPGEQLKIIGKNIKTYIDQPGNDQDFLFIKKNNEEEKEYTKLSDYVLSSQFKGDKCDDSAFFCIKENYYNNLYDEVTYIKKNSLSKLTFSLIEIFSSEKVKTDKNSDLLRTTKSSVLIDVFAPELNQSIIDEITTLNYEVKLDLPEEEDETILKSYLSSTKEEEKKRALLSANKVCVPINNLNNQRHYCYTYFNYKANTQICRCNVADEIVGIFDKTTANFYKLLQFESFKIDKINYFSGSIILSSLGVISIFSILLLIYDLFDDKKIAALDQLPKNQRVKHEYDELKCVKNAGIFKFAWYLTYFRFPFFNVFSFYNYNHPRYFRFFIQVFALLLSMFFSALPYYKSNFDRKQVFMDSRNVENENIDIHNFPYIFSDIVSGFIYSLLASLFVNIIVLIFSKLMKFRKIRGQIWKPRKDYLLNYVYEEIKSDVLLGEKWNNIKIRILALNELCSWKLLDKKKKDNKFTKYLMYKKGISFQPEAKNFAALELEKMRFSRSASLENGPNVPLIPEEELILENKFQSHCECREKKIEKEQEPLVVEQAVQPFTINKNIKSILPPSTIQKFERIKYKYIYNLNNKGINDDEENENNSIIEQKYEIEQTENYTYISNNKFNQKDEEDTDCNNIIKNIALNLFLFGLLIGLYILIIIIFHNIYGTYEGFIIKAWLIPALFQVTLFRFAINYLLDVIITLILFKYIYKRKTNKCLRLIFYIFIEKYMIYLNKIRLIISKYDKEFQFIQ